MEAWLGPAVLVPEAKKIRMKLLRWWCQLCQDEQLRGKEALGFPSVAVRNKGQGQDW